MRSVKIEVLNKNNISYQDIDYVAGSNTPYMPLDKKHFCCECGRPIYFHDQHPDDSAFICMQCLLKKADEAKKNI